MTIFRYATAQETLTENITSVEFHFFMAFLTSVHEFISYDNFFSVFVTVKQIRKNTAPNISILHTQDMS